MAVKTIYVLSCNGCGRFPPCGWERLATGLPTTTSLAQADLCDSEQDATAHAVKLGWTAYPVLCPACTKERSERDAEVRGDDSPQEDHGAVRRLEEGPRRPRRGW